MWVLILAIVMIGLIYGSFNYKKTRQLATNGNIIQREDLFWENTEYLYTDATYEEVLNEINHTDFSSCNVTVTPNYEGSKICAFVAKGKFSAALVYHGEENGEHIYEFSVLSWKPDRLATAAIQMNGLLTTIEKIFLSIDPDTEAEIQINNVKTKTAFF